MVCLKSPVSTGVKGQGIDTACTGLINSGRCRLSRIAGLESFFKIQFAELGEQGADFLHVLLVRGLLGFHRGKQDSVEQLEFLVIVSCFRLDTLGQEILAHYFLNLVGVMLLVRDPAH